LLIPGSPDVLAAAAGPDWAGRRGPRGMREREGGFSGFARNFRNTQQAAAKPEPSENRFSPGRYGPPRNSEVGNCPAMNPQLSPPLRASSRRRQGPAAQLTSRSARPAQAREEGWRTIFGRWGREELHQGKPGDRGRWPMIGARAAPLGDRGALLARAAPGSPPGWPRQGDQARGGAEPPPTG